MRHCGIVPILLLGLGATPASAGLADSLPKLFLDVVNKAIKGSIQPRVIRYKAPTSLELKDARLLDPDGNEVARIGRAELNLAVSDLFLGNITIEAVEIDQAVLNLKRRGDTLNLVRALEPVKTGDGSKSSLKVRLDDITVSRSSFSYDDRANNVRIVAGGISGTAHVLVDLKRDDVKVEVSRVRVRDGELNLEALDVPFSDVRLARFTQRNSRLVLRGGTGGVLGGTFSLDGEIRVSGDGSLALSGIARTPAGAWPKRLKPLAFKTPELDASFRVTGPLQDPTVEVDGGLGRVNAYGLRAAQGQAKVIIDRKKVRIARGAISLGLGARENVVAKGSYTIASRLLDLNLELQAVPLSELARAAELKSPPTGLVSGKAKVTGVPDGDAPLAIKPELTLRDGAGFSVALPDTTRVTGDLIATSALVEFLSVRARGNGIDVTTSGRVELDKRRVNLSVDLVATHLGRFVPELPTEVQVHDAVARGHVRGPYKDVRVTLDVAVARAYAYGVPIDDANAKVTASAARTLVEGVEATVSGGALQARIEVDTRGETLLAGSATLSGGELALLQVTDEPLPVSGAITSLTATLSGLARAPLVEGDLVSSALRAEGELLGVVRSHVRVTRDDLTLSGLRLSGGPIVIASHAPLWLRFEDEALAGRLTATVRELGAINAVAPHARGDLTAEVMLAGTIPAPDIRAILQSKALTARGIELGTVDAVARLLPDQIRGRAAQFTGRVIGPAGLLNVRLAYALERERINASVRLVQGDLAPWLKQIPEIVAPLEGTLNGNLVVQGDPRAPDVTVLLRVPQLSMPVTSDEPQSTAEAMKALKPLGPVEIKGELAAGILDARVCLAPSKLVADGGPCGPGFPIWLTAAGPLDLKNKALDLEVALGAVHEGVQELIIPLRELGMKLDAAVEGSGRARWQWTEEDRPRVNGRLTLRAADLEMQGAPPIRLERAAKLAIARNRLTLVDGVRFRVGEGTLRLEGHASAEEIDLTLAGDVGTPLLKLYTDEVTVARGQIRADLGIKGAPGAIRLDGSLQPGPDAAIGLRSLRQTVELESGLVRFSLEGGSQVIVIDEATKLSAKLGDGRASLHGKVELSFPEEGERPVQFDQWDVHLRANDVVVRSGTTFVDAGGALNLVGGRSAPRLKGNVEINDGSVRESFDLRDFVLEAASDEPSRPLSERLAVVDLEQLAFDVELAVRSFRGRAEIGTFPLDLTAAGDVRATGTALVPELNGSLEALTGELQLPNARFEVASARFEWSPQRPGLIPKIYLSALADLPAQGTCDVDVPVELTLEGDDLSRIDLELSAADSGAAHSRSDLLKAVLAGVALPACSDDVSGDLGAAWRALLSPVSTTVSREIENLLAGSVGGDFRINPFFDGTRLATDVRWQLGRRVQLEGETGIRATREIVSDDEDAVPIAGADVRMRLLLWDPFLRGRALFLEGELTSESSEGVGLSTRIETRLKWRIFQR